MKAVIFAGGTGTRLWPLSRKKFPKQFEKIVGDKSTFQLSVERLLPEINWQDIFISSNEIYKNIIKKQLPFISKDNLIFEPEKKDVGPAIALALALINKKHPNEPVIILWSDHLIKDVFLFKKIIKTASLEIKKDSNKIIFIAHKPRFPSVNLGYINYGKKLLTKNDINFYEFKKLKYRPDKKTAEKFFKSNQYAWNIGYFITSSKFILDQFKKFSPDIFKKIEIIVKSYGNKNFYSILKKQYSLIKSISFDNAILEKLDKKDALVIVEDIGWSDVGSWDALKEALQNKNYENVIRGNVHLDHVRDSLIYNYDDKKLIVAIDLDQNIIVNTHDTILIAKKESVPKIKKLVESFEGTEKEKHI